MLRYLFLFVILHTLWANSADGQYVDYIKANYTAYTKQYYIGETDTVGYYQLTESTGCPITYEYMKQYSYSPFQYDVINLGTLEHPNFRIYVFLTPKNIGSITDSATFFFTYHGSFPCGFAYDSIKLITTATNIQTTVQTTSTLGNISCDIFPNPYHSSITLHYSLPENVSGHLSLCDILGNEMMLFTAEKSLQGENSLQVDLSNVGAGIYFCKLQTASATVVKKVVRY